MSTGEDTQRPTAMPTRAGTPENLQPPATQAMVNVQKEMAVAPPPPAPETALTTTDLFDLNTVKNSGNFIFHFNITRVMAAQANYNPYNACANLNFSLQDTLATNSGLTNIPQGLYDVSYAPPSPGAEHGNYICQIPGAFQKLVKSAPVISDLEFTGDGNGNNYQLEYADYVTYAKKAKRPKNDAHWFHCIPDESAMPLPIRTLYEGTNTHIGNYGMAIQEHEWAFEPKLTKDKEKQDNRKFHVEYDLNLDKVPLKNGIFNVVGLNTVVFDPDIPGATGKIWFRPDLLQKIFGACKVCYGPLAHCLGHDDKPELSKAEGKRAAPSAADRNDAAKRRITETAAKNKGKFKF